MAFMTWCSILGPGRILLLLIACFITFYVRRALQQNQQQHQCTIYSMRCRSLLSENSGQISNQDLNTELCESNSNFKTEVKQFTLRLTSLHQTYKAKSVTYTYSQKRITTV